MIWLLPILFIIGIISHIWPRTHHITYAIAEKEMAFCRISNKNNYRIARKPVTCRIKNKRICAHFVIIDHLNSNFDLEFLDNFKVENEIDAALLMELVLCVRRVLNEKN